MSQKSPDAFAGETSIHPIDLVRDILAEIGTLPRLMQLHYVAQEPGLLEIMCGLSALSQDDRDRLREYLARHSKQALCLRDFGTAALVMEATDEVTASPK